MSGAADEALQTFASEVTASTVDTVAALGSLWVQVDSPDLTAAGGETAVAAPQAGTFEAQVNTLLGYASWMGMAVAVIGFIILGIMMAAGARRGDGQGMMNRASIIVIATIFMGAAGSVTGFLVPGRSLDVSGPVAFVQDQMLYLTLALAVLSVIVAGAKMAFTMKADPGIDLVKSLLTLVTVAAAGVVMVNALAAGTDALAKQIIDSSIGSSSFRDEVLEMLTLSQDGTTGTAQDAQSAGFLGGSVVLMIVGGLVAILVNLVQLALMALRTAMLVLMAGVLPLSAAFTNTETGRQWFSKVVAWTVAFLFYKPAAALIYAVAIKISTSGAWQADTDGGLLQFAGGLMLIAASVLALPVLIGFLSPVMGAMASSGGGMGMAFAGTAAAGAAAAQGASRGTGGRSGKGFGDPVASGKGGPSGAEPSQSGNKSGGKSGAAAAAGGKAGMALQAGKALMNTVKGTSGAANEMASAAAGEEPSGSRPGQSGGGSGSTSGGGQSSGEQRPTDSAPTGAKEPTTSGAASSGGGAGRRSAGGRTGSGSGSGQAKSGAKPSSSGGRWPSQSGAYRSGSSGAESGSADGGRAPQGGNGSGGRTPQGGNGSGPAGAAPSGGGSSPAGSRSTRGKGSQQTRGRGSAPKGARPEPEKRTLRDVISTQDREGGPDGANRI